LEGGPEKATRIRRKWRTKALCIQAFALVLKPTYSQTRLKSGFSTLKRKASAGPFRTIHGSIGAFPELCGIFAMVRVDGNSHTLGAADTQEIDGRACYELID
jgi:hypothetical protein